jgi:hypothetical protein
MGIPATFMLAPGRSPWRPQSEPTTSRDAVTDGGGGADMRRASNRRYRDVLAGGQDSRPGRARTDVLSRHADPHAMLKIAGLPPRRPHLPMCARPHGS